MTEDELRVYKLIMIENVITTILCSIIVLGLYYMGAKGYSFLGLLMLLNITTIKGKKDES